MQDKKTNVPKWSKPEYKNETTEEEKVELGKKKAEMMGRLENLDKDNNKRQIARLNNRAFLVSFLKAI